MQIILIRLLFTGWKSFFYRLIIFKVIYSNNLSLNSGNEFKKKGFKNDVTF